MGAMSPGNGCLGVYTLFLQHSEQALGQGIRIDNGNSLEARETIAASMQEGCCPKRSLTNCIFKALSFNSLTTWEASSDVWRK